jgi:23S rRNA pseudouridine1911/1915/1917 synthase
MAETRDTALPPVLYEDDDILVIDKPAGLIVQDSHTHNEDALEQMLPDEPQLLRRGVVHRLDKETSGVMVIAKSPAAQASLQAQFKERQTEKTYIALVWGKAKDERAIIDAPILRHPKLGFKYVVAAGGREAKTEIRRQRILLLHGEPVSLLEVRPHTGRTHQIRVHLAAMRLPIVGDKVYGRRKDKTEIRQFLHAATLSFIHPTTGDAVSFAAPLPADLQSFLDKLPVAE